jgi:hypothetical protein
MPQLSRAPRESRLKGVHKRLANPAYRRVLVHTSNSFTSSSLQAWLSAGYCIHCDYPNPFDSYSACSEVRTSTAMSFSRGQDEVISRVEKRIAAVSHIPVGEEYS